MKYDNRYQQATVNSKELDELLRQSGDLPVIWNHMRRPVELGCLSKIP